MAYKLALFRPFTYENFCPRFPLSNEDLIRNLRIFAENTFQVSVYALLVVNFAS